MASIATGAAGSLIGPHLARAQSRDAASPSSSGPFNILMVLTDQERMMRPNELPAGFSLPGHERLAARAITFENHQIGSCVCTPSRAVLYTGQHIQNNGMFDNTNFPWSGSLSTDIDTIGDLLRRQGYYTAYKGKWHLTEEFETANELHAPKRILVDEMEEYGFSDYFGVGDIIAHTQGGYLHDEVIAAMSRTWLRGQGEELREASTPWFLAVNLVNPHDVMYYNTDLPGQTEQSGRALMHLNREPENDIYRHEWDVRLPESRDQPLDARGRPAAHKDYIESRGAMVGVVPNADDRWRRLNNYYLNCIRDVDQQLVSILDELETLNLLDNTIVIYTADHGELGGAHGLSGKGATAYREQNNVPLMIAHPGYKGGVRCRAVTSHVDIAPTLVSIAGGNSSSTSVLPGKDITKLLEQPEAADFEALRPGALYNYNMLAYLDAAFFTSIGDFFAKGGSPEDLADQGFRPDLEKRGAIRSVCDGRYKLTRYFSPQEHHVPKTMEQLLGNNDIELFDLENDPLEMNNLALDPGKNGNLLLAMNSKLNLLIEEEVGEDVGQMLPGGADANWRLTLDMEHLRM